MAIKCGRNVTSTPHWHLTTDQVRACYNNTPNTPAYTREGTLIGRPNAYTAPPTTPTRPAPQASVRPQRPQRNVTPPQEKYYTDLTTALGLPNNLANFDGWTISPELDRLKDLRLQANERARLAALAARIPSSATTRPNHSNVEDGVYFRNGRYYKVVHAIHGSGRQYAKVFDTFTKKFVKAAGALYQLRPEHAISAEQATTFGQLYGRCVFCSLPLTDDRSIFAGYGETCAGNNNLPWGAYPPVDTTELHNNAK